MTGPSDNRRQAVKEAGAAMARLLVDDDDLVVRLSWPEGLAARRRQVRVPLAALQRVAVETAWWRALRGEADSGTWIPDTLLAGVRRYQRRHDFVAIRPGRPVVVADLGSASPFARIAVTVPDPQATVDAIRAVLARRRTDGRNPVTDGG
ncbi:hypothetical protein [Streptomyces sp. NPDC001530]|uniref:hypothetical protein n=1 Tax=Streptomyces sp. NPDC001530 TaxID=3364582 RepID=UPI0036A91EB5